MRRASLSLQCLAALAALLVALPSEAQALVDPTQPPGASAPSGPGASPSGAFGPVLSSIVLGPHRRFAVIDGREVRVGDKVGDARLVAIDADSVRLRAGRETRTLRLIPEISRRGELIATLDAQKRDEKGRLQ
jgi:MSHA biogenesis protein MshK